MRSPKGTFLASASLVLAASLVTVAALPGAALPLAGATSKHHHKVKANPKTTTTTASMTPTVPSTFAGNAHPTLKAGKKGTVALVFIGKPVEIGTAAKVPVEVWNGTSGSIQGIDVAGSASAGGKTVGSGDSQDLQPQNLAPNHVAFGQVFFSEALPTGVTFHLSPTYKKGAGTYRADAKVTTANLSKGTYSNEVVGTLVNPTKTTMKGPIETDAYCFTGGMLVDVESGFVSGSTVVLPPGGTGSFSIDVTNTEPCSTYLVGASGYGKLQF